MSAPDYFEFFGLERKLALDPALLEARFYKLSRQLHPDRFVRATPAEREQALQASATLNDAYRTLRDPIARAGYLLRDEPAGKPDAQLLQEMFDLQESLEAAQPEELPELRARLSDLLASDDRDIAGAFPSLDSGALPLSRLRALLDRRKYHDKMLHLLETRLAS